MEVGDKVFILPAHSIKFAGRWGIISEIDPTHLAPYKLKLSTNGALFNFSRDEFMTEHTYFENLKKCDKVFSVNREVLKVRGTEKDSIVTNGGVYHFSLLLPVTRCKSCNCDTTGLLTDFCESCDYPVFVDTH